MSLILFDNLLWGLAAALKVLLCVLVFYRGLHHRLFTFALYAVSLLPEGPVLWLVYRKWGMASYPGWYAHWSSVLLSIIMRTLVVAEISRKSLKCYPAIWSLVRWLLVVSALAAFTFAVIWAFTRGYYFILPAEQGFEIAILVTIVVLIFIGIGYHVPVARMERNIILGIGIYLSIKVISDSAMNYWVTAFLSWWNLLRLLFFDIAMVIWIIPLFRPLPALPKRPELLSERESRHLMLRTLVTMRRVTREMEKVRKSLQGDRKSRRE